MISKDVKIYNDALASDDKKLCEELSSVIDNNLLDAENKVWHGHPVWFLQGNPIVGYSKVKDSVRLLFWSGQSFDEPELVDEGSFKAAEARYTHIDELNLNNLGRWLDKSQKIQWDYKNIVKRKGMLEKLDLQ